MISFGRKIKIEWPSFKYIYFLLRGKKGVRFKYSAFTRYKYSEQNYWATSYFLIKFII